MDFAESLYVEFTLIGEIADIYAATKQYLEDKEFVFKKETPNKSLNALYMHKTLSRKLDVTFDTTEKGILISINDEFDDAKVRGEIFTLREDVNTMIAYLRAMFTYFE